MAGIAGGAEAIVVPEIDVPPETLEKVTETMAQLYRVVPVHFDGDRLTIATAHPQNLSVQDELRTFLGYEIEMVVANERDVNTALDKYYNAAGDTVGSIIDELQGDEELRRQAELIAGDGPIDITSAEALADSAPVRKLLVHRTSSRA